MSKRPQILNSRKATAYHEAGHAVIARVLTLASGRASIRPNFIKGTAGFHITHEPYTCMSAWEKRGKVRQSDAVFHARIVTYMAGAETELELLGRQAIGDGDDRLQIALMAERALPFATVGAIRAAAARHDPDAGAAPSHPDQARR